MNRAEGAAKKAKRRICTTQTQAPPTAFEPRDRELERGHAPDPVDDVVQEVHRERHVRPSVHRPVVVVVVVTVPVVSLANAAVSVRDGFLLCCCTNTKIDEKSLVTLWR